MKLLHLYKCVSGTLTTFTDVYYNLLKHNTYIEPVILWTGRTPTRNMSTLNEKRFISNVFKYNLGSTELTSAVTKDTHITDDIIVTTCKTLYDIISDELPITIKCKHLIILDTWNYILADREGILDKLFNYIKQSSEHQIYFGNPALFKWFDQYEHYEYYEKLNVDRLNYIEYTYNKRKNLILTREECVKEPHKKYQMINGKDYLSTGYLENVFQCKEYRYCRWHHNQTPPVYFENIGKLIFEFSYMSKPTIYSTENYIEDGLTHYLRLCGIDDTYNQTIRIPRETIKEKLCMQSDDLLIEKLKELNG